MGRYKDCKEFYINKAKRLIIPYVFATIIWVIPMQYAFFRSSVEELVEKYVLGISPSQLWFLLMLFGIFVIMWPLSEFIRKHNFIGLMIVGGLWFIGKIGSMFLPNLFQIWTTCKFSIYFWLGMKLCQHGTDKLKKIPVWVWLICDIALFILVKCIPNGSLLLSLVSIGFNLILNIVGALMSFVAFGRLSDRISWKTSAAFSCLKKYSFPIYLFHQQLLYCTITLLNGKINPYLNAVVNIVFSFGGSLLISWILMKFKITRRLIGEKV